MHNKVQGQSMPSSFILCVLVLLLSQQIGYLLIRPCNRDQYCNQVLQLTSFHEILCIPNTRLKSKLILFFLIVECQPGQPAMFASIHSQTVTLQLNFVMISTYPVSWLPWRLNNLQHPHPPKGNLPITTPCYKPPR